MYRYLAKIHGHPAIMVGIRIYMLVFHNRIPVHQKNLPLAGFKTLKIY